MFILYINTLKKNRILAKKMLQVFDKLQKKALWIRFLYR